VLLAAAALGMLIGDTVVGRFVPPRWRGALPAPLLVLLAAPYLLFALEPSMPVAAAAAGMASVGFGSTLLLLDRLMVQTPAELSGQALGLQNAGMLTMQGVGAAIAGSVAQLTTPATAIAAMAAASLVATAVLARHWRGERVSVPG
jgi:predicted MFS family arabinose efflux permease